MNNGESTRVPSIPSIPSATPPPLPDSPPRNEQTRIIDSPIPSFPTRSLDCNKTVLSHLPADRVVAPSFDPVVGWLVIIKGPGIGNFLRLGYGLNSIGRGEEQRCRINYGDEKISRTNHASVSYDPRGRKFYLAHGGGQNLTYLDETPIFHSVEIFGGESLALGDTILRFVPFCGPDFDYQIKNSKL